MAFFLFSFSEMVNAQSYARDKYSKIMWNYLEALSGFGRQAVWETKVEFRVRSTVCGNKRI